ncbi:DUF7660 family protein [Streptosporangium minutum]|uniref:DUF7660 family protein n=1 Tax=Streptosporangium minutum TaxID=569862 RepID=UPI001054A9AC|nr:hypothetical protein [Streptosporangium minutum]
MGQNDISPAAAEAVETREDLARYVEALHTELTNGAVWENDRLGRFLEALAAWVSVPWLLREHGPSRT